VEAGRPLEIDAVLGAAVELGELVGVATPAMRAIYQAAKLLERTMREELVAVRSVPMPSS
jgi:2-dehydropantoate 2-reductase